MTKQIYITTAFQQTKKKYWPDYVLKTLEEVKANPSFEGKGLHQYNHTKVYMKKFNTEAYPRLLFYEFQDPDNDIILYIPRHFFSSHDEYDKFLKSDVQETKYKFSSIEIDEINQRISDLVRPASKPALPLDMQDLEHKRDFTNTDKTYVFEMEEWTTNIKKTEFLENLPVFKRIGSLVINKDNDMPISLKAKCITNEWYIAPYETGEILYRFDYEKETGNTVYYLFDIAKRGNIMIEDYVKKYTDLTPNSLLKQARRGYPESILYIDHDSWKNIESDKDANLALSNEEVDVLNQTEYPFFVNGLAGSGKSTILYYLYNHIFLKDRGSKDFNLLFVSYSEKLVNQAKKIVSAIWNFKHYELDLPFSETDSKRLADSIMPFQMFLREHFLSSEEKLKFEKNAQKYIDYRRFKELYAECKQPERLDYTPAMVWSVIRSFIKGRSAVGYFEIDNYKKMPSKDRTIMPDDYKKIYSLFEKWYRPLYEEEGYWDDLDLIRYILVNKQEYKKFDVIYCDEAQDFTPVEINLILRLSTYNDYNLNDFKKIPIAFAGDPNQTVSPTGFSWNRLKDTFTSVFEYKTGVKLQDRTLNNNYRSKESIVNFANTLQLIRKCFLAIDDYITPQEQWNPQKNILPSFFCTDNNEGLLDVVSNKALCVITGDDGEYSLNKDAASVPIPADDIFLNSIDKGTLYTAISSKGMEFPVVVLYNFADAMPDAFQKIFANKSIDNESDKYECTHFLTKLYIAVSRAKDNLFIFDSKANYDKLWKHFDNNNTFVNSVLIPSRQISEDWTKKIGGLKQGERDEFISILDETFDPEKTANYFFENALAEHDVELMLRAESYYRMASENARAEECIAYSLKFKGAFYKAGEKFMHLQKPNFDEATDSYWQGQCWSELSAGNTNPPVSQKNISRYMLGNLSLSELIKNYRDIYKEFDCNDAVWQHIVNKIIADAQKAEKSNISPICDFLEKLSVNRGFDSADKTIADLFYQRKMYEEAANKWESIKDTNHKEYWYCKEYMALENEDHNQAILWKKKAGKDSDIIKNYSKISDIEKFNLDDNSITLIFGCLYSNRDTYSEAFEYPYDKADKLTRLYFADKISFVELFVLNDFSEEKFKTWIEDRVKIQNDNIFENKIPSTIFEKIFKLNLKSIESFLYLKDTYNNQVLLVNEQNRLILTDILADKIRKQNNINKVLESCFIDLVFGEDYNYPHAKKYDKSISRILSRKGFSRKDFIRNDFNRYFTICNFGESKLDLIKSNLRDYAETTLSNFQKTIKPTDKTQVKNCCYIFELTIEYIADDNDAKPKPDFDSISTFYAKCLQNKLFAPLETYFKMRMKANEANTSSKIDTDDLEKEFNIAEYLDAFTYDDSILFIRKTIGTKEKFVTVSSVYIVHFAKFIYQLNLRISDLDGNLNYIIHNAERLLDNAISGLLAADRIDDYTLKMLMFITEKGLYSNPNVIAKKYEDLAFLSRLEKLQFITSYLKERALHYWANIKNGDSFNKKALLYGIPAEIEDYQEWKYPIIQPGKNELSQKQKNITIPITDDSKIGEYEIALKSNRKTIWISRKGIDLLTIQKGNVEIEEENTTLVRKENEQTFIVNNNLKVSVVSANEILLILNNTIYKVKF